MYDRKSSPRSPVNSNLKWPVILSFSFMPDWTICLTNSRNTLTLKWCYCNELTWTNEVQRYFDQLRTNLIDILSRTNKVIRNARVLVFIMNSIPIHNITSLNQSIWHMADILPRHSLDFRKLFWYSIKTCTSHAWALHEINMYSIEMSTIATAPGAYRDIVMKRYLW